jgi:eukaryotic-like serine/threonine-protein kinase
MKKPIIFGKYLLLERINVGGMAEVFIAKAFGVEGFERILAIKKILPTMAEDQEFIAMFIDEARISVQLNHTNIVHIHELGKHNNAFYIAMEYLAGRDLRSILERYRKKKEVMNTAQAVFLASKICEGLDYAHRKKDARGQDLHIIHRDVSPQNILVSYEGEVKLIDFGIAKAANRSQKTQAGILKGKFGYMSPEQVRGLPIDRRSDIFAVGVILYEMLTGEKLFVGESDFSTLDKVRNAEVPLPSTFNAAVPPALERVVLKALAREQEDRYQWASDLQEDLMKYLLTGEMYSVKLLTGFMKETFAEELLREEEKMERFATISRPEEIEASGIISEVSTRDPKATQGGPPGRRLTEPGLPDGTEKTIIVAQNPTSDLLAKVGGYPPPVNDLPSVDVSMSGPTPSTNRSAARGRVVIGDAPEYSGQTMIAPKARGSSSSIGPVPAGLYGDEDVDAEEERKESTHLLPTGTSDTGSLRRPRRPYEVGKRPEGAPDKTQVGKPPLAKKEAAMPSPGLVVPPRLIEGRPRFMVYASVAAAVAILLTLAIVSYLNPASAGMLVKVTPDSAQTHVVIGGKPSKNNTVVPLEPGTYEVTANAPGFLAQRRTVQVARGQNSVVTIVLEEVRRPPALLAGGTSGPTGTAGVPVEGSAPTRAPITERRVEILTGGQTRKAPSDAKPSLRRQSKKQTVGSSSASREASGEDASPAGELKSPPEAKGQKGRLACSTNPAGAEVWVNGKPTGRQTPVTLANPLVLPTGSYEVVFKLSGKQSAPMSVAIKENDTFKLLNVPVD